MKYPDAVLSNGENAPVKSVSARGISVETKFGVVRFSRAGVAGDVRIKNIDAILAVDPAAPVVVWIASSTMYYGSTFIVRAELVKQTTRTISYIPREFIHGTDNERSRLAIGELRTEDVRTSTQIYTSEADAMQRIIDNIVSRRDDAIATIRKQRENHAKLNAQIVDLAARFPDAWQQVVKDATDPARTRFHDDPPTAPVIDEATP